MGIAQNNSALELSMAPFSLHWKSRLTQCLMDVVDSVVFLMIFCELVCRLFPHDGGEDVYPSPSSDRFLIRQPPSV